MSKPVRLPDYLHAEIERLAAAEKRSTANMVKVLLEQALAMDDAGIARIESDGELVGFALPPTAQGPTEPARQSEAPRSVSPKPKNYVSEPFSMVCPNRTNHERGVYCPECKGDGMTMR